MPIGAHSLRRRQIEVIHFHLSDLLKQFELAIALFFT
jgi:hypothetical protein